MKENRYSHRHGATRRREKTAPSAPWQRIYGSLALILVAFFLMLVSYSAADIRRLEAFRGQLAGRDPAAMVDLGKTGGPSVAAAERALEKILAGAGMMEAALDRSRGGLRMRVPGGMFFEDGSDELKPDSLTCLRKMAGWMIRERWGVTVEGHTGSRPPRGGRFSSNWELSTARAVSIVRFFFEEAGVPAGRLEAVGFAQYRPAAGGTADNERMELVFALPREAGGAR